MLSEISFQIDKSDSEEEKLKKKKSQTQDPEFGLKKKELIKSLRIKHSKRKLIVSSIPLDTTEEELLCLFNTALQAFHPSEESPVTSCSISEDKTHAVLEFKDKQHIKTCLNLDGTELRSRALRVQKHKSYLSHRLAEMKKEIREKEKRERETEAIMSCNIFPTQENRVFMGNLPTSLPEEEIRKMLESFGRLKSFSLVKTTAVGGSSRGFCFFEYWDSKVTDKAIEQLNQLEIGDKRIKVQRASQSKSSMPALPGAKGSHKKRFSEPLFKNGPSGSLSELQPHQLQAVQAALAVPVHAYTPSRCLLVLNIVVAQDLVDELEYQEIYEDIWQEACRHGAVETISIPRPSLETYEVPPNVGKVYIKFSEVLSAKKMKYYASGKTFNRRTAVISFYPEKWFNLGEFV